MLLNAIAILVLSVIDMLAPQMSSIMEAHWAAHA